MTTLLEYFLGRDFPEPPPSDVELNEALATPWVAYRIMLDRGLKQRLVQASGFSPKEIDQQIRGAVLHHLEALVTQDVLTDRDHRLLDLLCESCLDPGLRQAFPVLADAEVSACLGGICPPPEAVGDTPPACDLKGVRKIPDRNIARLAVSRPSLAVRDESADAKIGEAVVHAVQCLAGRLTPSMSVRIRLAAVGLWELSDQGDTLMDDVFELFAAMGLEVDPAAMSAVSEDLRAGKVDSLDRRIRFQSPLVLDEEVVRSCPEARKMLGRYRVILRPELIAAEQEFGSLLQGQSDGWAGLVYQSATQGSARAQDALRSMALESRPIEEQRSVAFDWCIEHLGSEVTVDAVDGVIAEEIGPSRQDSFVGLFGELLRYEVAHGESDLARHLRPTGYEAWYRNSRDAYRLHGPKGVEGVTVVVEGGAMAGGGLAPDGPLARYRDFLSSHHQQAAIEASREAARQRGFEWFLACVDAYDRDPRLFEDPGSSQVTDSEDRGQIAAASQLRANGDPRWWERPLDVGQTTRLLVAASRVGLASQADLDQQLNRHLAHFRSLGIGGDGGQLDAAIEQCVACVRGEATGADATLLERFLRLDPQGFAAAAIREYVDIPVSRGRARIFAIPAMTMLVVAVGFALMIVGRYLGREFVHPDTAPPASTPLPPDGAVLDLELEGWTLSRAGDRIRWFKRLDLGQVESILGRTVLPSRPQRGAALSVDRRIAEELRKRAALALQGRSAFGVSLEGNWVPWSRVEMRFPRSMELDNGDFGLLPGDRPWAQEMLPQRAVTHPVLLVLEVTT